MPWTVEQELARCKTQLQNIWSMMYPTGPGEAQDPMPADPFDVYSHVEAFLKAKGRELAEVTRQANNNASFQEEVVALRKWKAEHP